MNKTSYGEYFTKRIINELGVDENLNTIDLYGYMDRKYQDKIFSEDDFGNIKILVYSLYRRAIVYDHPGASPLKPNINNNREQTYYITRLKEPLIDKNGKEKKYHIPKGAGTFPFFPPGLIEKFENKVPIKTLILTEGFFKAFKGCMHNIDVVGLSSITHYRNKKTKTLHPEILELIKVCKVQNVIILYDGDCLNISEKAIENNDDLYKRPGGFYSSARSIQELLKDYEINIYFSHIISANHPENPKGLDDILILHRGEEWKLAKDISLFSKPGKYFYKLDISHSTHKLRKYFQINTPDDFYSFHEETIKDRKFIYNGTQYCWDNENEKLKIVIPAAARNYFRVGDSYYEFVEVPNKFQSLERRFERRLKSTIIDDHGKRFLDHVPKYKSFCNVPDHNNFHLVINNCFNIYAPFGHEPEEGNCDITLNFIKHIFNEQMELGLDYIQLLFQKPTQILPILCLVSKENHTGKTTFAKYLKEIFTQNVTIVGNDELSASFNTTYANKLIIISEETFLDKKQIIEKIKALSTADKILMNAKGKDHIELDFFGKFILLSNNEDNFIYASKNDIRYWVRKIPIPKNINVNILEDLQYEIPAFLDYLNKRKLSTQNESRMWFHPDLLITEALKLVQENSKPWAEQEIKSRITELLYDTGDDQIMMSSAIINKQFFKGRYNEKYISKLIKENLGIDNLKNDKGQYIVKVYQYPQQTQIWDEGEQIEKVIYIKHRGRPFEFKREYFINPEEDKNIQYVKDPYDNTINHPKPDLQENIPF